MTTGHDRLDAYLSGPSSWTAFDHVAEVAPRVSVVVKIDHRPGVDDLLGHKNARVAEIAD